MSQRPSPRVAYIESFDAGEPAKTIYAIANSRSEQLIVGQSGHSKPRDLPGMGPAVFRVNPNEIEAFRTSLFGYEWQLVELESPRASMFTRSNGPTAKASHAIRQIQEWRAWLHANQAYAAHNAKDGGLGLRDIVDDARGLILMGRRQDLSDSTMAFRRQMIRDLNIHIHTYDFLFR